MKTIEVKVFGKVQGVWFRASAKEQADKKGLSGYVMNLPDGSVNAIVSGQTEALDELLEWFQRGSSEARVSEVKVRELPYEPFDGFEIRR
ncbi:MAG: acylphosphatase [Saprospirales bacterium]|nr:MAG: acylphosphatase [Saprospirales bacterium]